jgi:hypothetical protein
VTGWTLEYIERLPLSRIWAFVRNWHKNPPTHRLLALFFDYGKGSGEQRADSTPTSSQNVFEITPKMTQAFGTPCRESSLHPRIRKSVEEFQSTPAYLAWRAKMKKPPK